MVFQFIIRTSISVRMMLHSHFLVEETRLGLHLTHATERLMWLELCFRLDCSAVCHKLSWLSGGSTLATPSYQEQFSGNRVLTTVRRALVRLVQMQSWLKNGGCITRIGGWEAWIYKAWAVTGQEWGQFRCCNISVGMSGGGGNSLLLALFRDDCERVCIHACLRDFIECSVPRWDSWGSAFVWRFTIAI